MATTIFDKPLDGELEKAKQAIANATIKTATQNVTTSASGTFTITKPAGASHVLQVTTSIGSTYYCVQYSETTYGVFYYEAPHNPPANGTSLTATILYV